MSQTPIKSKEKQSDVEIGFLGGGQMATAIARGVLKMGLAREGQMLFCEPNEAQVARLRSEFPSAEIVDHGSQCLDACHRVILAVKPQVLETIASSLASHVQPHHFLVSIAAGIPMERLAHWFRTERMARVMPNIACQSLHGASGVVYGAGSNASDREWCDAMLRAVGSVVHVHEDQLHAVTGVSGSGPAYVLLVIEALSDGGVMAGLPRETARHLAAQTVLGAAAMVLETGLHPAILREQVTSPAGTTMAALRVLEERAVRGAMIDAVMAAAERSRELAGPIRKSENGR